MSNLVLDAVRKLGLRMEDCRVQCYDGAGNMAGKCKGAASRIVRQFPLAMYVHCNSHQLNLCVVKACNLQSVRNMMNILEELTKSFNNSPKRESLLIKKVGEACPSLSHKKLTDICRTRWVQRLDALDIFAEHIRPVVSTLEEIASNGSRDWNRESTKDATGLLQAVTTFQFLLAFIITKETGYTMGLTIRLQRSSIDSLEAYRDVTMVRDMLKDIRNKNTSPKFQQWFDMARNLAEELDVSVSKPRTVGR